jgi:FAD/FMN-containing dehydrogenase
VAVRGGAHNAAGFATCDGGIVIDLSPMRSVRVDVDNRLVRVEGGATWDDVDRETGPFGLVAVGGIVSTTGVGGLSLGGGQGWFRDLRHDV